MKEENGSFQNLKGLKLEKGLELVHELSFRKALLKVLQGPTSMFETFLIAVAINEAQKVFDFPVEFNHHCIRKCC